MRIILTSAALVALAACGTSIPDSGPDVGAGVGFSDYTEYQARRDAALAGNTLPAPDAVSSAPLDGTGGAAAGSSEAEDIAARTRAALGAGSGASVAGNPGQTAIQPAQGNPVAQGDPVAQTVESAGISAENNFDAVSTQRSIEDDAALVAAQRQQYEIARVEALPSRTGGEGPNIVAYALSTSHAPGTQLYRRAGLNKQAKFERNCAGYSGPDLAQIDFLSNGGPERDRMGLDPDGDGYACSWDPRPFRRAAGG